MPGPVENDDQRAHEPTVVDPDAAAAAADDAPEHSSEHTRLPPGVPRKIGHYAIQSIIASGGMGTVYKAVQEKPRRVVAIKVMRAGVASGSALRRFEYEAQLLGRLRHPGIAQVYEAGTHEDGASTLPFFAMEYIPNAKEITQYAREKKLGTREKLELFAQVCDAVYHGHQKGIVHRDLKPSNILISPAGEPKIIDFGVARATDSDMALTVMQTNVGQLVGTVQYMSPEQCEADPDDLDTRSDVYGLGVTLYELLCDQLPYDVNRAPVYEATRIIREQDPTRPSTVNAKLRGDVETIVLKALEKERDRRYQSAAELARDIRRYLAGEAILARPSSMVYQFRVFARRNKATFAGLVAVIAVLLVSAVAITAAFFQSANNRLRAERESMRAEAESLRAEQERARAEAEAQRLAAAEMSLQDILASLDPTRSGDVVEVSDVLDEYGANIEARFEGQPISEARMRAALAMNYVYLNLVEDTGHREEHWNTAMGHLTRAREICETRLGEEHPETIRAIEMFAQVLEYSDPGQAEQLRRHVYDVRLRTLGSDASETLAACANLASILRDRGKIGEAESLRREAYDTNRRLHGDGDPATVEALAALAQIRQDRGALDEAEAMYQQCLEHARRVYKPGSKGHRNAIADMANVYVARRKFDEARALYDSSLTPEDLGIEWWLSGDLEVTFDDPTLIVYWEPWCPFSQVSVPNVQHLYPAYADRKVQIFGIVGLTQNATRDQAMWFIKRNQLSFANAKVDGRLQTRAGLTGTSVPSAIAVLDGEVVWAGHPAGVCESFLDGLAAGAASETRTP